MLVIYMDRDVAEYTLNILQRAGYADKESEKAEMALIAAIGQASIAHNPHKDFGHVQGENLAGNGTTDGLPAASDAEAAASIK